MIYNFFIHLYIPPYQYIHIYKQNIIFFIKNNKFKEKEKHNPQKKTKKQKQNHKNPKENTSILSKIPIFSPKISKFYQISSIYIPYIKFFIGIFLEMSRLHIDKVKYNLFVNIIQKQAEKFIEMY